MCGRYTLTDPAQLPLRFDVEGADDAVLPLVEIRQSSLKARQRVFAVVNIFAELAD